MPTILHVGPYRIFFYAADREEPPHVHVEREDNVAKYWLDPIRIHRSGGFRRDELSRIADILRHHRSALMGAWHEYFGR